MFPAEGWMLEDDSWKGDAIPEIMDGKNVADFIDPDIAEKLEALEREEERLEAEGFYNSDDSMVSRYLDPNRLRNLWFSQSNSEDERERAEMKAAREHRMASQVKKKLKNRPVLPRTAALTTLSEMSEKLTKAGYDPSRIVERATLIAKSRGAQTQLAKKRKRDEEMDIDEDGAEVDGDGDWMDVDEEGADGKRRKSNSGAAVAVNAAGMRAPKTNRMTSGLRDGTVGGFPMSTLWSTNFDYSKSLKRCSSGTSANGDGICMQRLVRRTVQSASKWYVSRLQCVP